MLKGVAVVPYCSAVTNQLVKLLRRKNIRAASRPPRKIGQLLCSVKDPLACGFQECTDSHVHVVAVTQSRQGGAL